MNINDLIDNPPKLHGGISGQLASWQLENDVLNFIYKNIGSRSKTLETGAGVSTILFAMSKSNHTCIVPDGMEINRIKEFCNKKKISVSHINFIMERSENILPTICNNNFDLVVIDGRHAFPSPFIDWYYTSPLIKIGGLLIIDDTHLWTGRILKKFLISEPEWSLKVSFSRTAVFIKENEVKHEREWRQQSFIVNNSKFGMLKQELRYLINCLQAGKVSEIITKINGRLH